MKTIDELLDRHAPMSRGGAGGMERLTPENLLVRLGVNHDELMELIQSGLLCPCGEPPRSGDDSFPFSAEAISDLKRSLLSAALMHLAEELQPGEDAESERRFCAAADFVLRNEREGDRRPAGAGNAEDVQKRKVRRDEAVIELRNAIRRRGTAGAKGSEFSAGPMLENPVVIAFGARMVGLEFDDEPLTGKLASDRYRKRIRDEDENRRDANAAKAGLAGAAAGFLLPSRKLRPILRGVLGGAVGVGGVMAARQATEGTKDIYGDRSRGAKGAENAVPLVAGVAAAGVGAWRLKKLAQAAARRAGSWKFDAVSRGMFLDSLARASRKERAIFLAEANACGLSSGVMSPGLAPGNIVFELAAGAIFERLRKLVNGGALRGILSNLRTPGTTANSAASTALKGAAVGAVGGGAQAVMDDDSNTGVLGGATRGAIAGAGVGAAAGVLRGLSPQGIEKIRRATAGRGYQQ